MKMGVNWPPCDGNWWNLAPSMEDQDTFDPTDDYLDQNKTIWGLQEAPSQNLLENTSFA